MNYIYTNAVVAIAADAAYKDDEGIFNGLLREAAFTLVRVLVFCLLRQL
jgi:hypothetical protein